MEHQPGSFALTEEDRRLVGFWAAECAERALSLFEARLPEDARPREAIEGVRVFAQGGKRTAHLRSLAWAALAAARESPDPIATAAARAAGLAAATAYTHALANPNQAKHVLGPAVYAALARELSGDPVAAEEELRWALQRASPKIREIARRWPARAPGRSRLDALYHQLDARLRCVDPTTDSSDAGSVM